MLFVSSILRFKTSANQLESFFPFLKYSPVKISPGATNILPARSEPRGAAAGGAGRDPLPEEPADG